MNPNKQQQQVPDKIAEVQNAYSHKDYSKLTRDQLIKTAIQYQMQNRRLKNKLAQHQPFKQKAIRQPNQPKIHKLFQQFQTKKFALKVCYLGFNYDGMACQSEGDNSIEEYIFKIMHTLSLIPKPFPADESFTRAGRTDKGVSAMGNVITLNLRTDIPKGNSSLQTSKMNYCSMLNSLLPEDIRIIGCQQVSSDFNARYWCTSRRYKYFFARNNLNIQLMSKAIKDFQGTHNFINFCKMNVTNTVNFTRTLFNVDLIKANANEAIQEGDPRNQIYYFYFVGNSFLWHQIRFMSSILFLIGLGHESPNIIKELLDVQKYPNKPNYSMAPDYPLILQDCRYENLQFNPHQDTIIQFYNTFNNMVFKKSVQKVMIINCMIMARDQLLQSAKITNEVFRNAVIAKSKLCFSRKSMHMHKSSGRGLDEAIKSLKGKKLQLYQKKAQKQARYDEKVRDQKNISDYKEVNQKIVQQEQHLSQ